jgi:prepilin-type N-terminal cleavage/methylation domain-containing protein
MNPHTPVRHQGFTLVETMIALVVMSVGLLALSILFVDGLRTTRSAMQYSAAVDLSTDLAERLRATGAGPLAADEHAAWLQSVRNRLPAGTTANVLHSPDRIDIRLRWPDTGSLAPATFELSVYPPGR